MNMSNLAERRCLKVSKYRRKRVTQLKELLALLDKYQDAIKMTQFHKERVGIVEDFLSYEMKKDRKGLAKLLQKMMAETFPIADEENRKFFELKAAMLYNYIHNREVSHL